MADHVQPAAQQSFFKNSQQSWGGTISFHNAKNIIQTHILSINLEKKSSQVGLSKNFIQTVANNRRVENKGQSAAPHTMVGMVDSPQPTKHDDRLRRQCPYNIKAIL